MKIETIEESAEKWVFETNGHKWSNNDDSAGDNYGSFIAGFKCCKEQTYSKEEVRGMLNDMSHYINTKELKDDDMVRYTEWVRKRDWFCNHLIEQLKKK